MKKIIVVAQYTAWVPEDMTVSQVADLVEEKIRDDFGDFAINVDDYHDESEQYKFFDLDDVMCGTESMISIGGE